MIFQELAKKLQENFERITDGVEKIFEVALDKDELWELYLSSYPAGTNELFRERREHDCSSCKHFIRQFGNVVVLKSGHITSIWDFETGDSTYQPVVDALSAFVKSKPIENVYVTTDKKIGIEKNHEQRDDGSVHTWYHFFVELPQKFVNRGSRTIGELQGEYRATKEVFKRSLEEITEDSLLTVLELIASNTLYKGTEWGPVLSEFLKYKKDYTELTEEEKEFFAWEFSVKVGSVIGRIRNHSIGTLLVNISEGMDLDTAVKKYESIIAPTNYKRPKAIFTQNMLEDAKKKIAELGYMDSLMRRFARLEDVTVNNILFSNKDAARRITGDVFDKMSNDVAVNPKRFSKVEEIPVNDFIAKVLPTLKSLEVLLENKFSNNMVSLIAPVVSGSPSMFKWNNGFSWGYTGNITDSVLKENVKNAGGDVNGVLRFSIQWNDIEYEPSNDLDAHCIEPNGTHIYYSNMKSPCSKGVLDVDIRRPIRDKAAVENITWPELSKMGNGMYKFYVKNYSGRNSKGFRAEIEFNNEIFAFDYIHPVSPEEEIQVAEVTLKDGVFSIEEKLPSNSSISNREIWNLKTNQFVPVTVAMYSPNYWDEQTGIGHKHFFFMLKDCINLESPNGFYNEFLKNDLMEHKRVFEALGARMRVEDVDDQLSGIGFSSTKRNEMVVKVLGHSGTEKIMKIKF